MLQKGGFKTTEITGLPLKILVFSFDPKANIRVKRSAFTPRSYPGLELLRAGRRLGANLWVLPVLAARVSFPARQPDSTNEPALAPTTTKAHAFPLGWSIESRFCLLGRRGVRSECFKCAFKQTAWKESSLKYLVSLESRCQLASRRKQSAM